LASPYCLHVSIFVSEAPFQFTFSQNTISQSKYCFESLGFPFVILLSSLQLFFDIVSVFFVASCLKVYGDKLTTLSTYLNPPTSAKSMLLEVAAQFYDNPNKS